MDSRETLLRRIDEVTEALSDLERGTDPRALREELEDLRDRLDPSAAITPPDPSDALAADGLAIVVGHTRAAQGAAGIVPPFPADMSQTPLAENHEYAWNTDLAQRIKARAERAGIRCDIFFRDGVGIVGAYANVRRWSPKATVELHFNAADRSARGTEVLFGRSDSRAWADGLQAAMVTLYGREGRQDRGIKLRGPGERGHESVTQLHPSALIEPFFGDNASDAALGVERKDRLADAILGAFARLAGHTIPDPGSQPDVPVEPDADTAGEIPDVPLLRDLIAAWRDFTPTVPEVSAASVARLKGITLAQWIEESGWARSDLASLHFNFAGMKGIAEVDAILRDIPAATVRFEAHDGVDTYLRFGSVRDFIRGYFMFLERSPYRGWHDKAERSPHDFIRFIGDIWAQSPGYAGRVIDIEARLKAAGIVRQDGTLAGAAAGDGPGALSGGIDLAAVRAQGATADFLALVDEAGAAREPRLRSVLIAQWGLESDWGRSDLARIHANFAGLEWSDRFEGIAFPVPHPVDPARGTFCRFLSQRTFVQGFWHRLDDDPAFAGWTDHRDDPDGFATFLGVRWRPADPQYAQKVMAIVARIPGSGGGRQPDREPDPGPTPGTGTQVPGVVLQVRRLRSERRRGRGERTVGTYQLFVDGRAVQGQSGMMLESRGPGDNTREGSGLRIEAGVYPLSTHASGPRPAGIKYKTMGFTDSAEVGAWARPSIRLRGTNRRSGILLHPGDDFLWSVGCFNATRPLADGDGRMTYSDSRARVIALIDAIREAVGQRFPQGNNEAIPDASIEVIGEPGPAGGDTLAQGGDFGPRAYAAAELAIASSVLMEATGLGAATAPDLVAIHDALAAGMRAAAVLGQPEDGSVDRIAAAGIDLRRVRSETKETLWTPWAYAVSVAGKASGVERETMLARLRDVAETLHAASVPIDDTEGAHSALVRAALDDDVAALGALLGQGAGLDVADRSGVTPLLAAAWIGAAEAVGFLLARGADPRRTVAAVEGDPAGDSELAVTGSDAQSNAAAGAALAAGDEARLAEYRRVDVLLRDALDGR